MIQNILFKIRKCTITKRVVSLTLALTIIFSALSLSSCFAGGQELPPLDFEYTLTDRDKEDALDLVERLEKHIDKGRFFKTLSTAGELQSILDYIYDQYTVSEIQYYLDLEDDEAYERYLESEDLYLNVLEESQRVLKKLYNSNLIAKKLFFMGWTEQEINALTASNEEVIALEEDQNDLLREYLDLEDPESAEWSRAVEQLYFKQYQNFQKYASLHGFDSYYEYACSEIYSRHYTKDQRKSFRQNVKEYLLPVYIEVFSLYQERRDALSDEKKELLSSLRSDPCTPENEYLTQYIDSYPDEMKTVMNRLFDRDALICSESENAYGVGFTNYSIYCEQPYVYLGKGCQDILTLIHELGHYTAFYHFSDAALPYDTCEVHSQGNEWLFLYDLESKLDTDVYEVYLLWRLRNGLEVIVASTVIDEFEETVYSSDILSSPNDLNAIMKNIYDSYEGLNDPFPFDEFYTYSQYVTMENPVYYLSYATSELAALSLYTTAKEDGYSKAQDIFIDLCLKTPTGYPMLDTLSDVGLPSPFEPEAFTRVKEVFEPIFSKKSSDPTA